MKWYSIAPQNKAKKKREFLGGPIFAIKVYPCMYTFKTQPQTCIPFDAHEPSAIVFQKLCVWAALFFSNFGAALTIFAKKVYPRTFKTQSYPCIIVSRTVRCT